ncbi:MAG: hypothetical protein JO301_07920, partial [Chitinophagaceae bacterium]|nr:hypothetical protein [Chitinophagaceae bacterium]
MIRKTAAYYFLFSLAFVCMQRANGQNASLLGDGTDDYIRRSQLLGRISLESGLMNRSFSSNLSALDSVLDWKPKLQIKTKYAIRFDILPVSVTGQFNSHHPWGGNDGSMIPAKGFQTAVSAGFALHTNHFSIQVRPEFIAAQNSDFQTFPTDMADQYWTQYYRWLNSSDLPEKFGNGAYTKVLAGQSSIRFNTHNLSLGLSTENMWWGPGYFNALVMSNNAPGFLHGTLNTIKPFVTGIGTFEGQIIGGSLRGSGILPPERNRYNSLG